MNENEKMQRLHHRRACGEVLSAEEQLALEKWYEMLDREEEVQINNQNQLTDVAAKQIEIEKTIAQISIISERNETIRKQNEILRRENEQLKEQLEARRAKFCFAVETEQSVANIAHSISLRQIISALQTMPLSELEQLSNKILEARAAKSVPRVLGDESSLLKIIAKRLPDEEIARMRELQRLRDGEQLTSEGYTELSGLIENLEELHAERITALAKLANLRGVTLETAMKQVGLKLPDHD